ncbi:MAG TPA: hypothetical protein VLV76_14405 [Candidatus Acidoferrum sp.]|nr:hypothetical protein [Candidatus Acidoferrum sp.]
MAFLCTETFLAGSDGKAVDGGKTLQNSITGALHNLTHTRGTPGKRNLPTCGKAEDGQSDARTDRSGLNFPRTPIKLQEERDFLSEEWKQIWDECTIEFADEEAGASIYVPDRRIRFGPFFVLNKYSITDFEKIILHEYLHAAFRFDNTLKEFHHGMMRQVLIYNLRYSEPANPVAVD